MLGIPTDVVDATEHLLRMADDFTPRRYDLGWANDRAFTFSAGISDAAAHPERFGQMHQLEMFAGFNGADFGE